jgi:hypothetical protein
LLERFPVGWNIASMGEVAGAFVGGEGVEQLSERLPEASTVRLAAVRKRALSLAKARSIGFKSGL